MEYDATHECLQMFAITGPTDYGIYIFSRFGVRHHPSGNIRL